MPVEIKELLVQAKLQEDASESGMGSTEKDSVSRAKDSLQKSKMHLPAYEREAIIEACVARMKEWFKEQQLR